MDARTNLGALSENEVRRRARGRGEGYRLPLPVVREPVARVENECEGLRRRDKEEAATDHLDI